MADCAHDCVYCGESLGSIIRAEVKRALQPKSPPKKAEEKKT